MSKKKPCGLDYCPHEEIVGAYASCSACAWGAENESKGELLAERTRRSTTDGLIDLAVVEADRKTEPRTIRKNRTSQRCRKFRQIRKNRTTWEGASDGYR